MRGNMKRSWYIILIMVVVVSALLGGQNRPTYAQNLAPFNQWYVVSLCSNTDYDAAAGKALGIDPAELRVDLVSAQTLDDTAQSTNVNVYTVSQALLTAHYAEIDQAVADGLLDAEQAKQLKNLLANMPSPYRK